MTAVVVAAGLILASVAGLVLFAFWTARRVEAAVPAIGAFITVGGVRLHYVDQGSGPVLLMIHGLASQLQSFTFALSARLPGCRLIILDRPGAGYSQPGPSAGLGAQAAIIAAFLRALDIDRALVVGHSLGGAISLALAVEHPGCVAGLALLAPASQGLDRPPAALKGLALRSDVMRWLIGWTLAAPSSLYAGPETLTALFGPDPVPANFGTRGGGFLTLRPWAFRNASRDLEGAALELSVYAARHREITVPVGVLFGSGDRILDYRLHGETLRNQIAGLDYEVIEQGGHMVPLSAPERSAAFIGRMAAKAGLACETTSLGERKHDVSHHS